MAALEDEQYRALVEQAPALVWRTGLDGGRDYFNATWLAFTGRRIEQELGAGWIASVHPDDVGDCVATQRDAFARREGFEVEYRLRRHDAVYRQVVDRAAPFLDATGAFAGFVGYCVDTEEQHARDESFGVNDFFDMSLDNLCVAGFDGYFKRVNPSWTRTLGWTAQELMSRPSEDFLHPDDRASTLAGRKRLQVGQALGPLVNRYRCKDGTYRWFEWRSVAHTDRGLVYAAARDVTEQKEAAERLGEAQVRQEKLERQLVFADRMASVGTLAAGTAHEINNPLAYVMANLSSMLEALGAAPHSQLISEVTELAIEAREGAERIRKIVRGLKTFSRAEEERRSVIEVQPLLELAINMTFNEIRHRGRLVKDYGKVPPIEADEARLGQVFINLLINAAQALPEGDATANEIHVATSTDATGRAVIEVRDSGTGIPATAIDRIFDPFFTTKPVGIGTGLGLSICHNIVTSLGGEISVQSEEGRGTAFRIVLPAAATVQNEVSTAAERAPKGAFASVLVVDDERSIGGALGRMLRGHDVTIVTSAKDALEIIHGGKHFDVILSDLMMPEMSGMEFYDELTRRAPQLVDRVVFISGGAFTPTANAFFDRVPNVRIEKPFDPQSIRALVQRFVG
jgi:PAS domain S-box-containing protein